MSALRQVWIRYGHIVLLLAWAALLAVYIASETCGRDPAPPGVRADDAPYAADWPVLAPTEPARLVFFPVGADYAVDADSDPLGAWISMRPSADGSRLVTEYGPAWDRLGCVVRLPDGMDGTAWLRVGCSTAPLGVRGTLDDAGRFTPWPGEMSDD